MADKNETLTLFPKFLIKLFCSEKTIKRLFPSAAPFIKWLSVWFVFNWMLGALGHILCIKPDSENAHKSPGLGISLTNIMLNTKDWSGRMMVGACPATGWPWPLAFSDYSIFESCPEIKCEPINSKAKALLKCSHQTGTGFQEPQLVFC